jgi:hypothetical protein
MRKGLSWLGMLVVGMAAGPVNAQTIEAGDVRLRLFGRVQTQFSTTSVDESELIAAGRTPASAIPASMFETRRVRFGAELEFEKWLTGKVETEFSMARLQVRDAFLNMNFDPGVQLRIGQFKKPFSLLQLTSSTVWPVIERGVRIRGLTESMTLRDSVAGGTRVLQNFRGVPIIGEEQDLLENFLYQNYDLGAAIHGRLGVLGYQAGVFNGAGSDRPDDTDGKSFAGRLTLTLPTKYPIAFGGAISHREFRVTNVPAIVTNSGTALEADVEIGAFRTKGIHLLGEFTIGDNLVETDDQFLGAQGILAFYTPLSGARIEGLEFAARASYGDPRRGTELDEGLLLTPGLNVYFFGRNRLMFNYDVFLMSSRFGERESGLRAQAQFYF